MENLEHWVRSYGYAAIFAGMLGEQSPLPLPGEPLLLAVGALSGTGYLSWPLACGVALAGTVVGDVLWYEIGRKGGPRVLRWLCRFSIEPDSCVRGSQDTFARHGAGALLIAKFLPGLNSVAQPLAGVLGMPWGRFLAFDVLGGLLWVGTYAGLGYLFHDRLAHAASLATQFGGWAAVILAAVFALYLVARSSGVSGSSGLFAEHGSRRRSSSANWTLGKRCSSSTFAMS